MCNVLSEQICRPDGAPEGQVEGTSELLGHPKGGDATPCLLAEGTSDESDIWMQAAKWQSNKVLMGLLDFMKWMHEY